MAGRGVNKVILVGNLGNDPDTRYLPNGDPVTNFSLATGESWKDKNTGERQERTEWHRIVLFGRLAEIAKQYLRKGSKVYLEGKIRTRKWQGQDGQDRYTTEIVIDNMQMLDSRASEGGDSAWPTDNQAATPSSATPPPPGMEPRPAQPDPGGNGAPASGEPEPHQRPDDGILDDDIPF